MCEIPIVDKFAHCKGCGAKVRSNHGSTVWMQCRPSGGCQHRAGELPDQFPPAKGLGDRAATALASLGITKHRWAELVKQADDDATDCSSCDGRQKLLNRAGHAIGLAKGRGPALQELIDLEEVPSQTVYGCSVHGRCLSSLQFAGEARDAVQGAGFHLCVGCNDFAKP